MALFCLLCQASIEKLQQVRHCNSCGIITCDSETCGTSTFSGAQEIWLCENCITVDLEPAARVKSP